jgi:mutator protein MutT
MKNIRAVAIIIKDREILLMHRINNGKEYFVFPGGGVEKGETIEDAVLREIKEEACLEVKIDRLLYQHVYDDDSEQFFYLCNYISGEAKLGKGNEAEEMKKDKRNYYNPLWIKLSLIENMLIFPLEIRDWLVRDIKNNFLNTPKIANLKISELRQEI